MMDNNGNNTILENLFSVPLANRDEKWNESFLSNVADAPFTSVESQILIGPDNFPYFQLFSPATDESSKYFVISDLAQMLIDNGFGAVINSDKGRPDWVFSYGDILNFRLNNEFYTERDPAIKRDTETLHENEQVMIGQPSESYLPAITRSFIRTHLHHLGIDNVKLFLMFRPSTHAQELVFNLVPDMFKTIDDFNIVMRHISWYLPGHYLFCGITEAGHEKDFAEL